MKPPKDPAPELPDFTYIRGIAAGGFADVFLYQQHQPRRQVALKVMQRAHVTPDSQDHFEHEANTMAEVSEHSNIVKIHTSGTAPLPDGRPYIVMEFCPGERFDMRSRGGHLPVSTVLDTGIQIASAVETAHRAQIFHRDLKPENILTTRNNKPALTDFGISSVRRDGAAQGAAGYSPQFAPPEVIKDPFVDSTPAIDLYSLGATLFYLLEGRAAYFVHGGDNSRQAIEARTIAGPTPIVERHDVPPELRNLIANAMASDPSHRPPSALAFAHALQDVQQLLHLPVTATEVFDVSPLLEDYVPRPSTGDARSGAAEETRGTDSRLPDPPLAGATMIGQTPVLAPTDNATVAGHVSAAADSATVAGIAPPPASPVGATAGVTSLPLAAPPPPPPAASVRSSEPIASSSPVIGSSPDLGSAPGADDTGADDDGPSRQIPKVAAIGLAVVVLLIIVAAVLGSGVMGGGSDDGTTTTEDVTPSITGTVVSPPTDVEVARVAGVPTVTWTAPDDEGITGFRVHVFDASNGSLERMELADGTSYFDVPATETSAAFPIGPDDGPGPYCAQVVAIVEPAISEAAPVPAACTSG